MLILTYTSCIFSQFEQLKQEKIRLKSDIECLSIFISDAKSVSECATYKNCLLRYSHTADDLLNKCEVATRELYNRGGRSAYTERSQILALKPDLINLKFRCDRLNSELTIKEREMRKTEKQ